MHAQKTILVSWYTDPGYIPPFRLSERQFTLGPQLKEERPAAFDAITPRGSYDLKALAASQGGPDKADLVVVWADASRVNLPLNIKAFGCPTVLCVGDTHHMDTPIETMVEYARRAGFDFIVSSHNRHHLHWFQEAGFQNLAWIPGLKARHAPRPFDRSRAARLAFVGQAGRFHPRRLRLIEGLRKGNLPLLCQGGSREDAATLYASSALSLNISLNGDLNLRVFEVLSAGGCLITDRLAPESGLDTILEPNREFLDFQDGEELADKVRFHLVRPDAAAAVAQAGAKAYAERLTPSRQIQALLDWVFSGRLDSLYRPDWDRRPAFNAAGSLPLLPRIKLYERIQEIHRTKERPRVLFANDVSASFIADSLDLQRLHPAILEPGGEETRRRLRPLFLGRPLDVLSPEEASSMEWDAIVRTAKAPLPGALKGRPAFVV